MKVTLKRVVAAIVLMLSVAAPVWAGPLDEVDLAWAKGDYALAMVLSRSLAERGNAEAQNFLGFQYEQGRRVPQDYTEAAKWHRLAADQGDAEGQWSLGTMYFEGRGVPKDAVEAAKWFRKAADQGDNPGQAWLGLMYSYGQGVPQNDVMAHMWLNLAVAQGGKIGKTSQERRDEIAKRMTRAEIAQAQKLAREWKPTKEPPASSQTQGR